MWNICLSLSLSLSLPPPLSLSSIIASNYTSAVIKKKPSLLKRGLCFLYFFWGGYQVKYLTARSPENTVSLWSCQSLIWRWWFFSHQSRVNLGGLSPVVSATRFRPFAPPPPRYTPFQNPIGLSSARQEVEGKRMTQHNSANDIC